MVPSLLNNPLFKVVLEARDNMTDSCMGTLRNSDPHTKPSDIARAQGQLEALEILSESSLKTFERMVQERAKKLTTPQEEEN